MARAYAVLPCWYENCDEVAVVLVKWWDKGTIDLTNMNSVKERRSCAKHFITLAASVSRDVMPEGLTEGS